MRNLRSNVRRAARVAALSLVCALAGCGDTDAPRGDSPPTAGTPPSSPAEPAPPRTNRTLEPRAKATFDDGPERFRDRSNRPVVAQVVYQLLKDVGYSSVPLFEVRKDLGTSVRGIYLGHVAAYLVGLGLEPKAVEEPLASFLSRGRPGVLVLHSPVAGAPEPDGRFVLFKRLLPGDRAEFLDPDRGLRTVSVAELDALYHGAALFLDGSPARSLNDVVDIAVDELVFHYGNVASGTLVRHTFRVRNRGGRPMKIHGIRPSCGCLATPLHRERDAKIAKPGGSIKRNDETGGYEVDFDHVETSAEVPPGGEIFVTGFYDTTNRTGLRPASFAILSNDPDEPSLELVVEGTVRPVVVFDPQVAYFMHLRAARETEALIWLRPADPEQRVEIRAIRCAHPSITFEPVESPDRTAHPVPPEMANHEPKPHPEKDGWAAVRVRIPKGMRVGPFRAIASIETNLADGPLIYQVMGTIIGNTTVRPAGLSFGRVPIGHARTAKLVVQAPDVDDFAMHNVAVSPAELFDVAVQALPRGGYEIAVTLPKGWQASRLQGYVTFESNDRTDPKKRIPISGFVGRTPR